MTDQKRPPYRPTLTTDEEERDLAWATEPDAEWRHSVTWQLYRISDLLHRLTTMRTAGAFAIAMSVLFLGAFCGELVWRLSAHH